MANHKNVLWRSLLLTILIFAIGILLNHAFDFFRIATIENVMEVHEIDSEAYRVERFFTETFEEEYCDIMVSRIKQLKEEIRQVGEDLGTYSRFSFFRRHDYDYLKRKYFLLELRFLATIQKLNDDCGKRYLPIIFFYEIDQDASERQGFILQEASEEYEDQVIVLSIDKDYEDEPLVQLLVDTYNATTAPTIVVDDQTFHGLHYVGELNATFQQWMRRPDPFAQQYDFHFTPRAAGINETRLVEQLELIAQNNSAHPFARGDANLIIGRLTNKTRICDSLQHYDRIKSNNPEEMALVYETSAAIGCGRNRAAFLRAAAKEWRILGNDFRANLLEGIARGARIKLAFDEHALEANDTVISGYRSAILPNLTSTNSSRVTIGNTRIDVTSDDIVLSQNDRVHRDWLGGQLANPFGPTLLNTFSERLTYNETELRSDIGWHEGGRLQNYLSHVNFTHVPAVGTLVARKGNRWFAADDQGVFRFEVPRDKLLYPTTRFLRQDLAVIIDTHGVNMLVEQALRHNADVVLSDCDHPGKVYAASYLNDAGVDVICYPDKYTYLALGHNLSLVGSPPHRLEPGRIVVGNRPVNITANDTILALNATADAYALWYYQTPASYFDVLSDAANLNVTDFQVDDFGQMSQATVHARTINATVFATRVFNSDDYSAVALWLNESKERRAILFHTASYPYGQILFDEFKNQTSFDDPNPVFE